MQNVSNQTESEALEDARWPALVKYGQLPFIHQVIQTELYSFNRLIKESLVSKLKTSLFK